MPSAEAHAYLISRRIAEEIAAGTLTAPPSPPIQDVHTSLIGIIPKPHQPGKFRLVIDLSVPHGASINDAISPELSSLTYPRVDQAVALISEHGHGTLIAKLDLQQRLQQGPSTPGRQLFTRYPLGGYHVHRLRLPIWSLLHPKLSTAVEDGYGWAISAQGFNDFMHYLDDFLFWSPQIARDATKPSSRPCNLEKPWVCLQPQKK